jgi:ammonium transporter, Amt family
MKYQGSLTRIVFLLLAVVVATTLASSKSLAAEPTEVPNDGSAAAPGGTAAPETPAAAPPPVLDRGDNAWMLTSSALVLFMTAPGLAMFYGGLVRKKNVLGVIMQCIFLMGLMSVIWALWGYSLSFGTSWDNKGLIGMGDFFFMKGVGAEWKVDEATKVGASYIPLRATIPVLTHMLFQGMFFIITPALICGAFAERMKFSAMVVFSTLWGTFVYCPLCHWVWNNGILAYGSPTSGWSAGGALDFAGGTVVHISSGVTALLTALLIGKRLGYPTEPMPPHNLTYTALGAAMLWVGWFGFNAGSALAADGIAASAFAATHFAAAAGTLAWAGYEWVLKGKPTVLGAASGAVAGLVCITPASGFVTPMVAILMGLIAGVICAITSSTMKKKFGYDDSLDAFGVHGVGGTLGAILTGVFATRAIGSTFINGVLVTEPVGLAEGGPLLKGQIVATAITWGYTIVVSFVLLKIVDIVIGLRVSQAAEMDGLDLSQHGEEGYIFV